MRERITRLFIIFFLALVTVFLAKSLADRQNQPGLTGTSLNLSSGPLKKIESLGGKILGKAIKILPGGPQLEIESQADEANREVEPIEEPMTNIQDQTDSLIESIKKLPEDQLEATKKQLRQEFCEGLLGEEEEEE